MTSEIGNGNGHQPSHSELENNDATNFAAKLFSNISTANGLKSGNLIVSPLLLEAALALLYLGSDGTTAEQMQTVLQFNKRYANNAKMANYYAAELAVATRKSSSEENAKATATATAATSDASKNVSTHIVMCSRIFMPENYEISDEFRKIANKYFHTHTMAAGASPQPQLESDASLTQICGKDYATRLMQIMATSSNAVLLVAANFQNKWFLPFSAYRTGLYEFHMNSGVAEDEQLPPKAVAMLFDDDMFIKFAEFRELDARAIELPYECDDEDEELSMLIILPNKRDGLSALLEQLCTTDLTQLTERMQMESVQVILPKFKIDFELGLRQCLEQLGISTIFNKEANFKNLLNESSHRNLHFENIYHKISIEVNESGSVSTNVAIALKPIVVSNSRQKIFRADHPFVFAVRNRDAVYFMGQVTSF